MIDKWDKRFLELAKHISTYSKDPSTKVGAVITKDKRIVSMGYNGFPRGVKDSSECYNNRELKYAMVVHAESNAIIHSKEDLTGSSIYLWPFLSCSTCSGLIIQSGINRVIAPKASKEIEERWGKNLEISRLMFNEAGIRVDELELQEIEK